MERIKNFVFKNQEYQIEVPTVGQYIDIENQKIVQSNGNWGDLIKSSTMSALRSVQIIECISILKVLCPKLFENFKVRSYKEIDAIDFVELLSLYTKEILPWYSDWFKNFNEVIVESSKDPKE